MNKPDSNSLNLETPVDQVTSDSRGERGREIEVVHPNLTQLIDFEKLSWPNSEEQASEEELQKRLEAFPDGIFMLLADGEPMAQITISPKDVYDPDTIDSFERMRDMEVNWASPVLWVTNMAARADVKGKGYVSSLMAEVMRWASENGYQSIMAGVTCDGFANLHENGQVANINEYMKKFGNPGVNTFKSAIRRVEQQDPERHLFVWNSDPITNYWPEDKGSEGYGVMVEVDLDGESMDNKSWILPPLQILDRISEEHFVAAAIDAATDYPEGNKEMQGRSARRIYHEYRKFRSLPLTTIEEAKENFFQHYQEWEAISSGLEDKLMHGKEITRPWLIEVMWNSDLYYSLFQLLAKLADRKKQESDQKPEIEYKYDLSVVNNLGAENRETVSGQERTLFLLLPAPGCKMDCDHCSPKHLACSDYQVTAKSAEDNIEQTREICKQNIVQTLKLFNAGNILWGSEFGRAAALHERYWELLPEILIDYPKITSVEIEVRLDEFTDKIANQEIQTLDKRQIVRERLLKLNTNLQKIGKQLRVILAPEYSDRVIVNQKGTVAKGTSNAEAAIVFLLGNGIPWLGYAMLGGRFKDRSLSSGEALESALETAQFILDNGGREAIINCQYLDPINQWEEAKDRIRYYVPSKKDIETLLACLYRKGLLADDKRVRISLEKEDIIKGTKGAADYDPAIDADFEEFISEFNNAKDQESFLENCCYLQLEVMKGMNK